MVLLDSGFDYTRLYMLPTHLQMELGSMHEDTQLLGVKVNEAMPYM